MSLIILTNLQLGVISLKSLYISCHCLDAPGLLANSLHDDGDPGADLGDVGPQLLLSPQPGADHLGAGDPMSALRLLVIAAQINLR